MNRIVQKRLLRAAFFFFQLNNIEIVELCIDEDDALETYVRVAFLGGWHVCNAAQLEV